ncbi:unnamed protein product [Pedinophyceae sp. YPF-701]|nr:unnamed protein product [Pedinophyceae sp. YPF-701]
MAQGAAEPQAKPVATATDTVHPPPGPGRPRARPGGKRRKAKPAGTVPHASAGPTRDAPSKQPRVDEPPPAAVSCPHCGDFHASGPGAVAQVCAHVKNVHQIPFTCGRCLKGFNSKAAATAHKKKCAAKDARMLPQVAPPAPSKGQRRPAARCLLVSLVVDDYVMVAIVVDADAPAASRGGAASDVLPCPRCADFRGKGPGAAAQVCAHMRRTHGVAFACGNCLEGFESKAAVAAHKKTCAAKTPREAAPAPAAPQAKQAEPVFESELAVRGGLPGWDAGGDEVVCPHCVTERSRFVRRGPLAASQVRAHIRGVHKRPFVCMRCMEGFKKKGALAQHLQKEACGARAQVASAAPAAAPAGQKTAKADKSKRRTAAPCLVRTLVVEDGYVIPVLIVDEARGGAGVRGRPGKGGSGIAKVACPHCDDFAGAVANVCAHMKAVHGVAFVCGLCLKGFATKGAIKAHKKQGCAASPASQTAPSGSAAATGAARAPADETPAPVPEEGAAGARGSAAKLAAKRDVAAPDPIACPRCDDFTGRGPRAVAEVCLHMKRVHGIPFQMCGRCFEGFEDRAAAKLHKKRCNAAPGRGGAPRVPRAPTPTAPAPAAARPPEPATPPQAPATKRARDVRAAIAAQPSSGAPPTPQSSKPADAASPSADGAAPASSDETAVVDAAESADPAAERARADELIAQIDGAWPAFQATPEWAAGGRACVAELDEIVRSSLQRWTVSPAGARMRRKCVEQLQSLAEDIGQVVNKQVVYDKPEDWTHRTGERIPAFVPGTVRMKPHGSFVQDMSQEDSDVDVSIHGQLNRDYVRLVVETENEWTKDLTEDERRALRDSLAPGAPPLCAASLPRCIKKRVLSIMRNLFYKLPYDSRIRRLLKVTNFLARARIPLLETRCAQGGFMIEVMVGNTAGVKSAAIREMAQLDARVRPLLLAAKMRSKCPHAKIVDASAGLFNSFSISLLALFHLQTVSPPVVPPMWTLFPGFAADGPRPLDATRHDDAARENLESAMIERARALRTEWASENTCSVGELLASFLVRLDAMIGACDRTGAAFLGYAPCVWRGAWVRLEPGEACYQEKRHFVVVPDPLEVAENCGRSAYKYEGIVEACKDGTQDLLKIAEGLGTAKLDRVDARMGLEVLFL